MNITKYISVKNGLIGALLMGVIVFFINVEFGWESALIASLKQGAYTFLFGGAIIKLCETLSLRSDQMWKGILTGAFVASLTTITAVFIIHNLKGTPLPVLSTLPVAILGPPGFVYLAWKARIESLKPVTVKRVK